MNPDGRPQQEIRSAEGSAPFPETLKVAADI
jgi:hypothetical protein